MYKHTQSKKTIPLLCITFFFLRLWRAHILSIFDFFGLHKHYCFYIKTHGRTVTLNSIVYFRCITSDNLIICREKSALNHTKIMDLKASYWLECDCFTETWFSSHLFFVLILCFNSLCIYSCSLSIIMNQRFQLITVVISTEHFACQ